MAIRGSLDTFSLPELLQIIESGNKSGRLSFSPSLKGSDSKVEHSFELWFEQGNFVTILDSMKYQALIANIQENSWVNSRLLIRAKYSCPKDLPLGTFLQQEELLTTLQINSLFQSQLNVAKQLFNIQEATFEFKETDKRGTIADDGEEFPWKEMTGRKKNAGELSLEAMRDFDHWQRFDDDLPLADSGLHKLISTKNSEFQLVLLESQLLNAANSNISLKSLAKETITPLKKVQQTALSMIFAGLVEEVPVINAIGNRQPIVESYYQSSSASNGNVAVKTAVKPKVSNSLINNLVSFLRNKF